MSLSVQPVSDGTWNVIDKDERILANLATNADAWRWVDRHSDLDLGMEDTRRRVRASFAER